MLSNCTTGNYTIYVVTPVYPLLTFSKILKHISTPYSKSNGTNYTHDISYFLIIYPLLDLKVIALNQIVKLKYGEKNAICGT
jgi:hypothetical protein